MQIKVKRGTRAQVNAAKTANGLALGELYLVTDEPNLLIGTGAASYLEVSKAKPFEYGVACSDEITALTTGTKVTFRSPCAFTLTAIRASLTTAQTSGTLVTVNLTNGGAAVLGTKVTIDNTERTSTTAATAATITAPAIADDAELAVSVDALGDGTAKGLKVTLIGVRA